jgi:hypothetical protein
MDLPIRFPHPADVIADQTREYQRRSVEDRLNRVLHLITSGRALLRGSPGEEGRRIAQDRSEADWRRAHREVFERHGR